jgi:archaemetzincin
LPKIRCDADLRIHILRIGNFDNEIIEEIINHLNVVFYGPFCSTSSLNSDFLKNSYNTQRGQYHSTIIIKELRKFTGNIKADKIFAMVDVDLYVPGLNFVFGEAECPGKFSIISVFRLKPEFYGYKNYQTFVSRVKKESTHELGHTMGLFHCKDSQCVMFFSNSILDTDHKREYFCDVCDKKIARILKKGI